MEKAPVLFIVFNRPAKTKLVLKKIAMYRPKEIFIAADGPRNGNAMDATRCEEVRKIIKEEISWDCNKHFLYRNDNKGCRDAVSEAITWFFNHVASGIILEDDCVADPSFFEYAALLLKKYEDDKNVFSIAGANFGYRPHTGFSYSTSRYMNMWGWATWRRVALGIDYSLKEWGGFTSFEKNKFLFNCLSVKHNDLDIGWIKFWRNIFDKISHNKIDTWDYQWFYFQFKSAAITLVPAINLVENIGFDEEATHTREWDDSHEAKAGFIELPLKHPTSLLPDKIFEEKYVKRKWAFYRRQSVFWHIKFSVHQLLFPSKHEA